MSQNKEGNEGSEKKPGVKIQDLSPKKDAKGGGVVRPQGGGFAAERGPVNPSGGGASAERGPVNPSGSGASADGSQGSN